MPPDRELVPAIPGEAPSHESVQQLVEAERGQGVQGVRRAWQASDSNRLVLTSDSAGVKISRDNGVTAPSQVIVDGTVAGGGLTGTYPNPTLALATVNALVPPGSIWPYAGASAPAGWFLCAGQTINRSANPVLFALIGTTYNTGGEAGTDFRLPNLQGRVILGVSGAHPLSTPGGAETVAAPTHTHPGTHSHGLNSHVHDLTNTHTHHMRAHTHTSDPHDHGLNAHDHSLNGHQHTVNIDHNHTASTGLLSGIVNRVAPGTAANPNHPDDGHGHAVAVAHVGTTSTAVAASATLVTGANSGATASTTPDATGGPSLPDTDNPTLGSATGGPTAAVTATATDGSAPAASFGSPTLATMPPFLSLTYIIRGG